MTMARIFFLFLIILLAACKPKPKPVITNHTEQKKDTILSAIHAVCFKGVDTSKKAAAGGCKSVFLYKYLGRDSILKIIMDWDKAVVNHLGQVINLEKASDFKVEVAVFSKKIPENQVRANNICSEMYFVHGMKPEIFKIKRGTLCVAIDKKADKLPVAYAWLKNAVFINTRLKKQFKLKEQLFWGVETGGTHG